jgi:hypothetical protein
MSAAAVHREVKELAAQAVVLFSAGLIDDGSRAWRDAVVRLVPHMPPETESHPEPVGPGAFDGSARFDGAFSLHPLMSLSSLSPPSSLGLDDRVFSVYASAVHYHPAVKALEPATTVSCEDLGMAASCFYNLGLCHHLRSLMGVSTPEIDLDKAVSYYKAAQNLLIQAGVWVGAIGHETTLQASFNVGDAPLGPRVLGLALLNNMGCIYDRRYEIAASRATLDAFHSLLKSIIADAHLESEAFIPFLTTAALYPSRGDGGGSVAAFTDIHAPCA